MSAVALVTDSTAYLPPELIERYHITVVPLYVRFGEEVFRDGVDITPEAFYARLRTSPVMSATSQPSAGDFLEAYRRLIEGGASAIVSIHISTKMSGTVASALMAKEQIPEVPIWVVDSLSTSMGQGFQVLEAARRLEAGQPVEEVVRTVEALREHIRLLFVVDTLEFLHRGGRIGGAQAFLGSLLNLKPLLAVRDGQVDAVERVRTKRRAVQRMLEILTAEVGDRPVRAAVIHGGSPEEGGLLSEEVRSRLNCHELYMAELSPVIGTHAGPGTVGVVICPVPA
ncbi:MAG: DegV family protein [Chloroflexia bacterium]